METDNIGMERKYNKLRQLHSSNVKTVEILEKENQRLNAVLRMAMMELTQAKENFLLKEQILHKTLNNGNVQMNVVNVEVDRLKKENTELKEEIRKLRAG